MNSAEVIHHIEPSERIFDKYPDEPLEKDRACCMADFIRGVLHNVNGYLQNLFMLGEILLDGQQKQDNYALVRCPDSRREWERLSADQRRRLENLQKQTTGLADRLKDLMVLSETETREKDVQLNHLISRFVDAFRGDLFLKHRVKLDLQLEDGLPMVRIPGSDLITAMVHLARYALARAGDAPEKTLTVRSRYEEDLIRVDFRVEGNGNGQNRPQIQELIDQGESKWPAGAVKSPPKESSPECDLLAVHRLLSQYGVKVRTESGPGEDLTVLEIPAGRKRRVL